MNRESISTIEILESGEITVVLASGGKPMYQYIYREAAEVCWDNERKCFKAPAPRKWSYSDWYHHIISVVASGLGVSLELSRETKWVNVPAQTRAAICAL